MASSLSIAQSTNLLSRKSSTGWFFTIILISSVIVLPLLVVLQFNFQPRTDTCESKNVVYLITCARCNKQYVGETSRTYRKRILEHRNYVKRKDMSAATGRHFNIPGHKLSDLKHQVIAILHGPSIPKCPKRLQLEERLIERLRTMEPHGLNDKNSQRV